MVKHLTLLIIISFTGLVLSQKEHHSISISAEIGPGLGKVLDYSSAALKQFEIPNKVKHGYTLGYDYFHYFYGNNALSFGVAFNTTIFPQEVLFTNLSKLSNTNSISHNLASSRNYLMCIDLPIRYYFTIKVGEKNKLSPYLGLKIRNISYIGNEERNTTVGGGWHNIYDGTRYFGVAII